MTPFVTVGKARYSFRAAIVKSALYALLPQHDRVLYVDADTVFVADPSDFGQFVEEADFAIALHQSGCTVNHVRRWYGYHETDATIALAGDIKVPNSGVFIWKRSFAVEFMFKTWLVEWKRFLNWDDQFPLMRSMYYTEKRYPEFRRAVLSFGWNSKTLKDATVIHHYFGSGKAAPGGSAKALWAGRVPVEKQPKKLPVKRPARRPARRPALPVKRVSARSRRPVPKPAPRRPAPRRPAPRRPVRPKPVARQAARNKQIRTKQLANLMKAKKPVDPRLTRGLPLPATHIHGIPAWQSVRELALLESLAAKVGAGELIVETGTLYGATVATMAAANPLARIVTIDLYRWHPMGPSSPALVAKNLERAGLLDNVIILQGDSQEPALTGHEAVQGPIALAAIDGGHTYEVCLADLENYGARAKVIAVHDFASKMWISVTQAVTTFLIRHQEYRIVGLTDMLVVLARVPGR